MGTRSALVIDDSKSARFALRRYLEAHAYSVDTAESAESAFSYLKEHHPEVIFLDHVMPGVDGFDVLNSIKSDPRTLDIPVVICSSNEGEAFTQEARFKGAADVLPKPPTPQQLARVLSSLTSVASGARVPGGVATTPVRPVYAQPSVTTAAPAPAAPAPQPRDEALLERVAGLFDQLRTQLLKATQDLAQQLGELKAQVSRLDRDGAEPRSFARLRARSTRPAPLFARSRARRKLPRR